MWWLFRIGLLLVLLGAAGWWWPWLRALPEAVRARRLPPTVRGTAVLGLVGFVALQWVPYGWDHSNPPVLTEPLWQGEATRPLVVRSCFGCHSNETEWPWHTNIAPGSWLAMSDVLRGREVLNFSEWVPGTDAFEDYVDEATEAVEEVEDGDMPPWRYLLIHPDADLDAQERATLIDGLRATFGAR